MSRGWFERGFLDKKIGWQLVDLHVYTNNYGMY